MRGTMIWRRAGQSAQLAAGAESALRSVPQGGTQARHVRCSPKSPVPDQLENVQVMLAWVVPGIVVAHPVDHQLAEVLWEGVPHPDGAVEGGLDARVIEIIEDIAVALVIRRSEEH